MSRPKAFLYITLLLQFLGLIMLGYFTNRQNFQQLIFLFGSLFVLYALSIRWIRQTEIFLVPLVAAFIFRLALLFFLPNLSDDFYRFVWDGRLSCQGINPFQYLPSELINNSNLQIDLSLFDRLNSKSYYSVYPPVSQAVFYVSSLLSPENLLGSIIIQKLFILLCETGTIFVIIKLLAAFQLPAHLVFLYALNPLVIVELTGNLHYEAGMIFFMLLSVYWVLKDRPLLAGIPMALAIGTKLWPLIFLPFFLRRTGAKKFMQFAGCTAIATALIFLPLWGSGVMRNFGESIQLYFRHFEFNGSLYYLIRWTGYQIKGFNVIDSIGIWLAAIIVLCLLLLFLFDKRKNLRSIFAVFLFALTIYFFFSTTVHPWYITPLIALSVFTRFRFAIVWSAVIPLTYLTYSSFPYEENIIILIIEYIVLFGFLTFELINKKKVLS